MLSCKDLRKHCVELRRCYTRRRGLLTLAIETSCDDTSVAILDTFTNADLATNRKDVINSARLLFHKTVTADNSIHKGIHPVTALKSHRVNIGDLVQQAISCLPTFSFNDRIPSATKTLWGGQDGQLRRKPDVISVTRGPGMRSNLAVGLDVAKGLSLAWNIPLIGVHHMQAHALTARLISALNNEDSKPAFPFLSLLVSGGHTLLIKSMSVFNHVILASTADIAIGDCLDKAARYILPEDELIAPFGKALEDYAFKEDSNYEHVAPQNRMQELEVRHTGYGWHLNAPMREGRGGRSSERMEYSFSGLLSALGRVVDSRQDIPYKERQALARHVQIRAFEHLCGRLLLYFKSISKSEVDQLQTVVVSGGVASNHFLRHLLRSMLDSRGYHQIRLVFPPVEFCTDNAAMIAWAGTETYREGKMSGLSIEPIKEWSIDSNAEDGGILGAPGWIDV